MSARGPLKITLAKPSAIRRKIADAEGRPLAQTMIFFTSRAGSGSAVSDAEGAFQSHLEAAGEYHLYVVPDQNQTLATDPDYLKEHASNLPVVWSWMERIRRLCCDGRRGILSNVAPQAASRSRTCPIEPRVNSSWVVHWASVDARSEFRMQIRAESREQHTLREVGHTQKDHQVHRRMVHERSEGRRIWSAASAIRSAAQKIGTPCS